MISAIRKISFDDLDSQLSCEIKDFENENEIQKPKKELEKIRKSDNQKFDKALKEFSKVLATMPDDEAD